MSHYVAPRQDAPPGFDPEGLSPPDLPVGSWPIASIALDVSGRCNLACRYCAETATQPIRPPMSEAGLEDAWRFFNSFPQVKNREIHLGSGEPLLALPLLRKLEALVRQAPDPKPAVHLTTNGTLATPELCDWLVESGWRVKISLDGPQEVQDTWRIYHSGRGSYTQAARAVHDLAQRLSPTRFSVTSVLCRGTHPQVVYDSLVALGVRRMEMVPVVHENPEFLPSHEDLVIYEQFLLRYARIFLESKHWEEIPLLNRFRQFMLRLMGYSLWRIPCASGRSLVGIAPDGGIYPCYRFIGIERYRLGQLPTGIGPQASEAFQMTAGRSYEQRLPCSQCWAAPICGGPCFAVAEMFGEGEPFDLQCAYILAEVKAAVWLLQQLRQENPERLLGFFPPGVHELIESVLSNPA